MKRFGEEQDRTLLEMRLVGDAGNGLVIPSGSQTTISQRKHWIGILKARDQEEDHGVLGEESGKAMCKEVGRHGRKLRNWPRIGRDGKGL